MKQFSLEPVLKHRTRLKNLARNRFQHALNQLSEAQKAYTEKHIEYQTLVTAMADSESLGMLVDDHIRYQNRIEFLAAEVIKRETTLSRKRTAVIQERNHLIEKSKEERVLKKLKEKQNQKYQQFIDKKESALLDEIAALHRNL